MKEFLLTVERTVVTREHARVIILAESLDEAKALAAVGDWKKHRVNCEWLSWSNAKEPRYGKAKVVRSRKRTKKDKRVHLPCGDYGWAQDLCGLQSALQG
jgi:hypothetical protein